MSLEQNANVKNDNSSFFCDQIAKYDEEVAHILHLEDERQSKKLILIASESECPAPIRMALASTFTNIYAEGYPSRRLLRETNKNLPDMAEQVGFFRRYADRRYYKGVEYADFIESLASRRASALFAANGITEDHVYVNVQPLSGAAANNAVYEAFAKTGDTVLGMDLTHGGHLTHGSPVNSSGKNYNIIPYHANFETGEIDYEEVERLAKEHKPVMIIAGYSAYPRLIDWKRFRDIAHANGAILFADMSHIAGLVAGKAYPSPVGIADVVSFTTHKTLCGPRGACILTTSEEYSKKIDSAVFPGEQGGPHVNAIAAKAILFKMANTPEYAAMQAQVIKNSRAMAEKFQECGLKLAYNGTDSHMVMLNLRDLKGPDKFDLRGEIASRILDFCGITCNKNTIPGDTSAAHPSALRFGTTWITQRGFKEADAAELAQIIADALKAMIPYKYIENSGEIGRAKIPLSVMQEITERVNALIQKVDGSRVMESSGYPYWVLEKKAVRRSPLYDLHAAAGYKMGTLYGREMTEYCKSEEDKLESRFAITDGAASGIFEIRGERAPYFLNDITSTLISGLEVGASSPAFILKEDGEIIDAVMIGRTARDRFIMLTSQHKREELLSMMRALSDGYILFDSKDIYAKIQGPVVIEDLTSVADDRRVTNIKVFGEGVADEMKQTPGVLKETEIAGCKTLVAACINGFICNIIASPKDIEKIWNDFVSRGFQPIGYRGAEALIAQIGMPTSKKTMTAIEMYKSMPESMAKWMFRLNKNYFTGQRTLASQLPYVGEKKKFVYTPSDAPLKNSCLYEEHKALGARMAPFAGYNMPVWYTSINEEHRAVRTAAGLFDVTHMGVLSVKGKDACRFLDTITSNYALRLLDGQSQYSYLIDPDGTILDDIMVYRRTIDDFIVVVNAANADKINLWLKAILSKEYVLDNEILHKDGTFDVAVKDLKDPASGDEMLVDMAIQGRASIQILSELLSDTDRDKLVRINRNEFFDALLDGVKVMISRTGYTGEDYGYELYLHPDNAVKIWRTLLSVGAKYGIAPCGLGSRDSTRIEAGLPLYGHELEGRYKVDPIEAGYGPFVKFHKPFFVGRTAMIEKERKRKMEIIRFRMENKNIRVVQTGSPVINKRGEMIGYVTSCAVIDGRQYGLAYVNKRYCQPLSKLEIFILSSAKANEKQKKELTLGDKVLLPEGAEILTRFPEKDEFENRYNG